MAKKTIETVETIQIVVFRLNQTDFGVPIDRVRRIEQMIPITRVPKAPPFLEGVANIKGEIVPVVDLKRRFELPAEERGERARILIVTLGDETVGMLVDAVTGIERLPVDSIEPPPPMTAHINGVYLTGMVRRPAGSDQDARLLILLDLAEILTLPEKHALAKVEPTLADTKDGGR